MITALDELTDLVMEFVQRTAGRPLSETERASVARLLDRLDQVRATLTSTIATSPSEGMRIAMAGHDRGRVAGRVDH